MVVTRLGWHSGVDGRAEVQTDPQADATGEGTGAV